jgi:2,4-dienoyl-CoA reductase-like NADH-dependent reductase (Old Yellow Enzyme family)
MFLIMARHNSDILILANKISWLSVKAAMAEKLAVAPGNQPMELHFSSYERWGKAGYGMIITGEDTPH